MQPIRALNQFKFSLNISRIMDQATTIAQQFVNSYYTTLMTNKLQLIQFYTNVSTLTYGGQKHLGLKDIGEKIESLGFQKIVYKLDDFDLQPGPVQNSMLIFITGSLQMDDSEFYKFAQTFQLLPNGQGGFYLHNDIFRLVY